MSSLRRIVAVGLPTAGLLTALSLGGAPAMAGTADQQARPVVAVTTCAEGDRGNCGYGTPAPGNNGTPDTPATGAGTVPTRGSNGYGTPAPSSPAPSSPAPSSPTPTGSTDTVPPGVSPSSATPSTPMTAATTPGGGVSAGGVLPVTGAPMGAIVSLGALLVAAGAGSVWYSRRRRSA
jgi:LPXTG-motif cell wall-anchored protein